MGFRAHGFSYQVFDVNIVFLLRLSRKKRIGILDAGSSILEKANPILDGD
jgi:hypothetical protein